MVFNSIAFLVFLAIVLTFYYRLRHRAQNVLLVVASYVFYGWWDWRFLGLLLFTTFFDYWCALRLEATSDPSRKKGFLAFSMALNLGVIGVFKYFDFFAEGLADILNTFGMRADLPTLHVILPLGISFYTFLSMSYTIDVYRRELKAVRNPLDFMLYVSFFPHLVAGPIVRAKDLLPQCVRPRVIRREQVIDGIWLCLVGYLKKIVIADRLAPFVDAGFSSGQPPFSDAASWLVLYAFAFQIYGDFSGYSDIARGLAKLMGFELVHNFKAPYLVSNPAAFWRHWHISLSVWLRDYLYIPLGGNRHGAFRTTRNLMITMVLGGLWHGAGIAFLAWGFYHGILLVLHRGWDSVKRKVPTGTPAASGPGVFFLKAMGVALFFHLTCIGWLLFRSGTVPAEIGQWNVISGYLATLWIPPAQAGGFAWPILLLGSLVLVLQWKHAAMDCFSTWTGGRQATAVAAVLVLISTLGVFDGSSFIYFQF
ncbi:MBOAT family protein [Luteolibacter yonseiensis]|uniref:MBOAT family protein n=1 Tax=Luteolibacter yonseiensis TaxID=1144680 RepID=A0A934R332_9BACT|nr:MBOAT family protein [Luteolibacter yonseiensis]MBK1814405.1 MBOAT family protein [Luteolibacter yonseiensis]